MATKTKAAASTDAPRDRRCSFRAVQSEKKKAGVGKLAIEHRLPGSTIWIPSITGLDAENVEAQLRRLEGGGCTIEYNEFFQPIKTKTRR